MTCLFNFRSEHCVCARGSGTKLSSANQLTIRTSCSCLEHILRNDVTVTQLYITTQKKTARAAYYRCIGTLPVYWYAIGVLVRLGNKVNQRRQLANQSVFVCSTVGHIFGTADSTVLAIDAVLYLTYGICPTLDAQSLLCSNTTTNSTHTTRNSTTSLYLPSGCLPDSLAPDCAVQSFYSSAVATVRDPAKQSPVYDMSHVLNWHITPWLVRNNVEAKRVPSLIFHLLLFSKIHDLAMN